MAAVDYAGIRNQLKTILDADSRTSGSRVYVEEEPQFGLQDVQQVIAVFMDTRTAPAREQSLSAGKRTRYFLRASLWTVGFSIESYRAACDLRDALLAQMELVLMDNRTVGGKVTDSWLEGGQMFSAHNPQAGVFVAMAETVLMMDVSAVNT